MVLLVPLTRSTARFIAKLGIWRSSNIYVSRNLLAFTSYCDVHRMYHNIPLNSQSVILPGPERIRASRVNADPEKCIERLQSGLNTVYDIVQHGLKISGDGDCLGTRSKETGKYQWLKYSEVIRRSQYVGSGFQSLGVPEGNNSYIGVYTKNCTEFVLSMLGCVQYSMVLVTLYGTFGADATSYIIKQAKLPVVVCDENDKVAYILRDAVEYPNLRAIVTLEETNEALKIAARNLNIELLTFKELEERGKASVKKPLPPKPDDLFVICYTSGTTGQPKGAMISNKNTVVCAAACDAGFESDKVKSIRGTIISYLPAAHIYEIMNEILSFYYGRRIGFFNGDITKILDDFQELRPTVIPLVPRLMNRIYQSFKEKVNQRFIPRQMLKLALKSKTKQLKSGILSKDTIWDKILFQKLQAVLGGNVEVVVTTSAPVAPEVMRFFRCALGCPIFEAYGQTEVLASNMTVLHEVDGGFVGPPLPCNHVKVVDVPEMNYYSKDDVGEICIKGPNVFNGYLDNEEATNSCIDEEGWVHTGDIGRWLSNGTLAIIDRKKYLFKLSQGEYIAPEKIENVYSQCNLVAQIYVDGMSDKDFVVAVIVPDHGVFNTWTAKHSLKRKSSTDLLKDKNVRIEFLKELHKKGNARNLNHLEQVRNIYLHPHPFTEQNGFLTPTLKLKRNYARKEFDGIIKQLYEEGEIVSLSKEKKT